MRSRAETLAHDLGWDVSQLVGFSANVGGGGPMTYARRSVLDRRSRWAPRDVRKRCRGLGEEITLELVAAAPDERIPFLAGLDALRDDDDAEVAAHLLHARDDASFLVLRVD